MNFLVRPAKESDKNSLLNLAAQFSLLNLPNDEKKIVDKIKLSEESFAGEAPLETANYLFVCEDIENKWVIGSSQIKAQHGSEKNPTYSFELKKKEKFSKSLGVGFIHQVLKLKITTEGPTELGGLVVHRDFRSRPEKVGKLTSFARFLYIGMNSSKFKQELHSEMAPPLTKDGRSEFWESLGRRFTGMPYWEADALSHRNKEFIQSLFPKEEIYLALLDPKARLVIGRVSEQTSGALHLLNKLGFVEKNEVDPFDGGPHLKAMQEDTTLIKNGHTCQVDFNIKLEDGFDKFGYMGINTANGPIFFQSAYRQSGDKVLLPDPVSMRLGIADQQDIFVTYQL